MDKEMTAMHAAMAFAIVKAKSPHMSASDYLATLIRSSAPTVKSNNVTQYNLEMSTVVAENDLLKQKLLQHESKLEIAALKEELKTSVANAAAAKSATGAVPTSVSKKKYSGNSSTGNSTSTAVLKYSKAARLKAEKCNEKEIEYVCASLKKKDEDLAKDIEYFELIKSLSDACAVNVS
ncbi:hypothetical protein HK100_000400, partial [Physocladia obscura]